MVTRTKTFWGGPNKRGKQAEETVLRHISSLGFNEVFRTSDFYDIYADGQFSYIV